MLRSLRRKRHRGLFVSAAAGFALLGAAPASAFAESSQAVTTGKSSEPPKSGDEITVFGRAEKQIGVSDAATAGTVGGADLTTRPVLRVAQLLEVVPA